MIRKIAIACIFVFSIIIKLEATNKISISPDENSSVSKKDVINIPSTFSLVNNSINSELVLNNNINYLQVEDDKKVHALFQLDVLSLVSFGPSLHGEIALGKYIGLSVGYRFISYGILINSMYDDVDFNGLVMGGFKAFVHPKYGIDGFFLSTHFEYGKYTRTNDYWDGSLNTEVVDDYELMIPAFEFGYRWIWESGFSLEVSDNIAVVLYRKNGVYEQTGLEMEMIIPYSLSLKLGFAF